MKPRSHLVFVPAAALAVLAAASTPLRAQLFASLEALENRLAGGAGPKGLALGDLDGDGRVDVVVGDIAGGLAVHLQGTGGEFREPIALETGVSSLRQVLVADLTDDGRPDIAAAAPYDARVLLFENLGGGDFASPPRSIPTWQMARNLATGDLDGDGRADLVVAGRDDSGRDAFVRGVGLRLYRGEDGGSFAAAGDLRIGTLWGGGTRPVFSVVSFRPSGADGDELAVTHAQAASVWVVAAAPPEGLAVAGTVPLGEAGVFSMAAGAVTTAAAAGAPPDLVTANRELGLVQVRRGVDGPGRFDSKVVQELELPGGPRSVEIVDLDGDGWNDVVVVLRNLDRVVLLRNDGGVLAPATEMVTGASPREVHAGDLDGDGEADLAIINRRSRDVSVLPARRTGDGGVGFGMLDTVYLVDGSVADLEVADINGDGRDDVLQLHRESWEMSVRLAGPDGTLSPPVYHPMGKRPTSLEIRDVTGDGRLDAVSADLGRAGDPRESQRRLTVGDGTLSVRAGDGKGGFGELMTMRLPEDVSGRLFGLSVADFDGDGLPDIAAAFFDCRLAFFRNTGDGGFAFVRDHLFAYEARDMATGDFDGDGDIDIAGIAFTGEVVVIENRGTLLEDEELVRISYPPPTSDKFGSRDIRAIDINADGDLDLVSGTGKGVMVYLGGEGMAFSLATTQASGVAIPATSVTVADLDEDGDSDIVVSCAVLSCVLVLTQEDGAEDLSFRQALTVDVPSGELVRTGDLDGDGHIDLVGSGDRLWTALSSRAPRPGGPRVTDDRRPVIGHPVINEVLAVNNAVPLSFDGLKKPDYVEIFNGGGDEVLLDGWELRLEVPGAAEPRVFTFPEESRLPAGERLVVVYSKTKRSPFHTGFKIPGSGGVLTLADTSGDAVDSVDLPAQFENASYARFRDGMPAFVFSPVPTPGLANDPGAASLLPVFTIEAVESARGGPIVPGEPIRIVARGRDDIGIVSASIVYRRIDPAAAGDAGGGDRRSAPARVVLYDDGFHGDGAMQDGIFAGTIAEGLPRGAEIEFFIDLADLDRNRIRSPRGASFARRDGPPLYSFAIGRSVVGPELSEVVALNETIFEDEGGGTPDYVEIRNCTGEPLSLRGVALGKTFPVNDTWYRFPDRELLPGEHLVVLCDGRPREGELHAPFTLDSGGDRVMLMGCMRGGAGAAVVLDSVAFDSLEADTALAREVCGGPWRIAAPTPGMMSGVGVVGDANGDRRVLMSDAISILEFLFRGGTLACAAAADVNRDGEVDLSDAVTVLGYLFLGTEAPVGTPVRCSAVPDAAPAGEGGGGGS